MFAYPGRPQAQSALDGFDSNANNLVRVVVVQPDGKILIGGNFITVAGITRNHIARINADGTLDTAFDPNVSGTVNTTVNTIAVQSDGKILAGGFFTTIGGQTRNNIARLDGTTGLADSWNPNADSDVFSIAVQSDGKVIAGGGFTIIGGQPRSLFARLTNDTAALSTLSVTQITLTLTRNGSGAQFARVIFEQSIDNGANYTLLGTATNSRPSPAAKAKGDSPLAPQAAGYTLTGLNLPAGQNTLIRARGFYRTGFQSGSDTTEDKVQIAFFALFPTASPVSVGGYVLTNSGRAPRGATVTLTDANGNAQTTTVNRWGQYQFNDIAPGQTYFVTVTAKGFAFTPPTRIVTPNFDLTELNFLALPPPALR